LKRFCVIFSFVLLFTSASFCTLIAEAEQPSSEISARSAILINADTGAVIFEKNAYEQRAMASTTKIMSALLTLEAGDLDRQFTADSMAIRIEGSSMGLREGDIVTRRILTAGMLLPSGNDASQAAAVSVSGSLPEFVKLMNERARQLGLNDTQFRNPSGLDADGHYSTAHDLALLTSFAMQNEEFARMTAEQALRVEFGNPPFGRWLYNNNKLLHMYDGAIGVKTGFTDNARRCLVSAATRGGVTLIVVTLNAHDDWNDHIKMFDYGFSMVKNQPVDYDLSRFYVDVAGGDRERAAVRVTELPTLPLSDAEMKLVEIKAVIIPFIYAGFEAGEQVGLLEFYLGGKLLKAVPLVTAEACVSPAERLTPAASVTQFIRRNLM
jgi:D-alanyl-D-alanine carboxypeptidase/D-alanyl-D-alanine carboxypeptidase (penicillin-binding protein 5/6)